MHRYDAAFQIKVGAWTNNKKHFAYGNVLTWKHLTKNNRYRELKDGLRMISDNKGISWHSGAYGAETCEHVLGAWQIYEHTGDVEFLRRCYLDHFDKLFKKRLPSFAMNLFEVAEKLERISLREKRDEYAGLQQRIEKLKEKYRIIRDQKIRERVEALGVKIQGDEDRETLLRKEKEYTIARQKIEFALESFYRSASSLVFQLNKRHITRHMSIFRCIDKRFETGEIFVKWDESPDDEWLLLIYIKNNSPDEGIVIEDKTNPEKNISHEFKNNEIFKASDTMVDSLTQLIARKRAKNNN